MNKNNHALWRFVYRLHRYIGLISAIVLLMLAITGIALNHTEALELDSHMIKSTTILDWYGIDSPKQFKSFATKNHWLTQADQALYFDQILLLSKKEQLMGAIETSEFIVTALTDSILLLSGQGELIEQIPVKSIERIGLDQDRIVVKSRAGTRFSEDGLLSWLPYQGNNIAWSKTEPTPETIKQRIKTKFRSSVLPLERVMLDLHSGRLFGNAGVLIVDITGFFLIVLALSGCAIWLKHKFRSVRLTLKSYKKH